MIISIRPRDITIGLDKIVSFLVSSHLTLPSIASLRKLHSQSDLNFNGVLISDLVTPLVVSWFRFGFLPRKPHVIINRWQTVIIADDSTVISLCDHSQPHSLAVNCVCSTAFAARKSSIYLIDSFARHILADSLVASSLPSNPLVLQFGRSWPNFDRLPILTLHCGFHPLPGVAHRPGSQTCLVRASDPRALPLRLPVR